MFLSSTEKPNTQSFLTPQSIFLHWQTPVLVCAFFAVRIISFFTADHLLIQGILVFFILLAFGTLYYLNPIWAWYMVLGEILLGGSGHLLELFGLSLRTILLIAFMVFWHIHALSEKEIWHRMRIKHAIFYVFIPLWIFLLAAAINGFLNNHDVRRIIQDLLPFFFFTLLLPAYHLIHDEKSQAFLVRLVLVFILGSAIFSLATFVYYAGGWGVIHDTLYQWYRDIALGKITDTGGGFFRIVLPEHLLMVPIGLLISSLLMRQERHNRWWYIFLGMTLLVLVLNLSRAYAMAFAGGLLVLKISHSWKRWLTISCGTLLATILLFTSVHFLASRGASFGWELFGIRVFSVFQPSLEVSAYTRMELLPPIFEMMRKHPIMGSGLGATVTFIDPSTNIQVTTPHFDWGYFEMFVELGPLGLVAFLLVIGFAIVELAKKIRVADDWHDFYVGLLGGCAAFLVMTLTTPALFHVFGIVFLLLVFTISMKPHHDIFDGLIRLLYRIFNREN